MDSSPQNIYIYIKYIRDFVCVCLYLCNGPILQMSIISNLLMLMEVFLMLLWLVQKCPDSGVQRIEKETDRNKLGLVYNSYWLIYRHKLLYSSRPALISQLYQMCKDLCSVLHHVSLLFSNFFLACLLICKNVPYYQRNSYYLNVLVLYSTCICKKHYFFSKTTEPVITDRFFNNSILSHNSLWGFGHITGKSEVNKPFHFFFLFFHCL